jgi:hypothetical protein
LVYFIRFGMLYKKSGNPGVVSVAWQMLPRSCGRIWEQVFKKNILQPISFSPENYEKIRKIEVCSEICQSIWNCQNFEALNCWKKTQLSSLSYPYLHWNASIRVDKIWTQLSLDPWRA